MNETIQDGITDSGIREPGMPLSHRHLGGDHSGGSTIAIIQDFKQVLRLRTGQGITEPVIEDQELGAGEGVEEFGVGAVGVGKGDVVEEPRSAEEANGEVVAADRVREGTSEESLDAPIDLPPLGRMLSATWMSTSTSRFSSSFQLHACAVGQPAVDHCGPDRHRLLDRA